MLCYPELARSPLLRAFLEFDKALARAQQQRCAVDHAASSGATPRALQALIEHNRLECAVLSPTCIHMWAYGWVGAPRAIADVRMYVLQHAPRRLSPAGVLCWEGSRARLACH